MIESHHVPERLTEKISLHQSAMNGTNQKLPRCEALSGVVGKSVRCQIYENRPSPCRSFSASFENGEKDDRCDRARLNKGLLVLSLLDWCR